jgi:hypothetical protein
VIVKLLDLEKDLRLAEAFLLFCNSIGPNYPRNYNCCKDEDWFLLMEEYGFLKDGKFLSLIDIIQKASAMNRTHMVFALESVGCDLSLIAAAVNNIALTVNMGGE